MSTNNNIFSNTIAEYYSGKLASLALLNRIASSDYLQSIKLLISYGYVGDAVGNDDINEFINLQIEHLKAFIIEYCPTAVAKEFLFNMLGNKKLSKENLLLAKKLGTPYLNYLKINIDITNILSLYRGKKLELHLHEVESHLVAGGFVCIEDLFSNDVPSIYSDTTAALTNNNIASFRLIVHELLLNTISHQFTDFSTIGPFIKFALAKISELKTVKLILISIKNNITPDSSYIRSFADE